MNPVDLEKLSYVLITGASRGIGQSIAVELAKKLKADSEIVLLARDKTGLEHTKSLVLAVNANISVQTFSIDLVAPTQDTLAEILNKSRTKKSFELAVIVHNVGTVGDVSKPAIECTDRKEWSSYLDVNLMTVTMLNAEFCKSFPQSKVVVNVTSKAAIAPFKSFAWYCAGKAAREMYFRVMALEQPDLLILNYSPGPVDTDMTVDVQANAADSGTRDMFRGLRENQSILKPSQTAAKLISVLEAGNFKSGDHIDYYD